jgi:hypothetical protein
VFAFAEGGMMARLSAGGDASGRRAGGRAEVLRRVFRQPGPLCHLRSREAETAGVRELYFTGGEHFLHRDILDLLACALAAAPTTVLTNGTRIGPRMADRLAALAAGAAYSLEIRVSLDDVDRERNDRVRGRGAWAHAVRAIRLLDARGLLPIVTATGIFADHAVAGAGVYERFRAFLLGLGIKKPRVKLLPVFAIGRMAGEAADRLHGGQARGIRPRHAAVRRGAGRRRRWRLRLPDPGASRRRPADGGRPRRVLPAGVPLSPGLCHLLRDRDVMSELLTGRRAPVTGAPMEPEREWRRIAIFGGVYNNAPALAATLEDARHRGAEAIFCLGDMGGFGPRPGRVFPLLRDAGALAIQGNYEEAVAAGKTDCGCGYTDPRDSHCARLSYTYTLARTSPPNRAWLAALPRPRRVRLGEHRLLMCHGSPGRINEFLWESTTPNGLLLRFLADWNADALPCTHTGLHWHRPLPGGAGHAVNVGVVGRPANDGSPRVWYTLLTATPALRVEFVPVSYDHEELAREIGREALPAEFAETIRTGWWTTCLENLPGRERARGKH